MKRILKEPLLHFLLLGAALFIGYRFAKHDGNGAGSGDIVVTKGEVENLAAGFTKTWRRSPTPAELSGLIRDYVREEIYCREARALGLDRDDPVIRRRLQQKMEFVFENNAAPAEPDDTELNAYLRAHADRFRVEQTFTFHQVYLDPTKHGDNLAHDAAELLARLQLAGEQADLTGLGDAATLEHAYAALPARDVARLFGSPFEASLRDLPLGRWQGPVRSEHGVHLVLVTERTGGRVPELAEVRDAVRNDWMNAQRLDANEKSYEALRARYKVTVEGLNTTDGVSKLAGSGTK